MNQQIHHAEGNFQGHRNLSLYYQCWLPAAKPKAILLVVPGLAEHSGRYANLVDFFVPRGYALYSLDLRGHGKSEGLRCHVDSFSDYLTDLKIFYDIVRAKHSGAKIFLVGHSMGATVALAYTIDHQHELAGLVLSGAGLKPGASITPLQQAMARIISLALPKMGVTTIEASAISQDKAVVDAYVNDPLVYRGKVRARLGVELLKTIQKLPKRMSALHLPVLIMHGTEDRLCNPEGSYMIHKKVSSKDKTLKLYEGFHHEVFNEPGRNQVMADMASWLEAHL